jgi:hypothetical protein
VHKCGFYLIPIEDLITSLTLLFLAEWYSSTNPKLALNPSSLLSSAANTFNLLELILNRMLSLKGFNALAEGSSCLAKLEQKLKAILA